MYFSSGRESYNRNTQLETDIPYLISCIRTPIKGIIKWFKKLVSYEGPLKDANFIFIAQ